MEIPDNKQTKTTKPWFWDLLHRADVQKPEPLHEITFRTPEISDDHIDQQWLKLTRTIDQTPEITQAGSASKWVAYRVVAAMALLLLTGSAIWTYVSSPSMHTYATHYGETARVKLPDGSLVTLNAHSKLTYQDWEVEKDREVWLEGEAFFEVQKKKRPGGKVKFVVHTADLHVEVLGTRFNVSDRGNRTQVVLEEGKIRLHLTKETGTIIYMKPGELIEYVDSAPLPFKRAVDPHSFVSWKDDQLVLNGKSMQDIAQLVTENYGIEVIIQDTKTARLQLQGSIPAHNLDELIEALTLAADIKISRESNKLIFKQP